MSLGLKCCRVIIPLASTFMFVGCAQRPSLTVPPNISVKQANYLGMKKMQKGEYAQARQYFSVGLRQNIRNCSLNFLNSLSYQLEGRDNNVKLLDYAKAGYANAIKYCPEDPWSYYYKGVIYFQKRDYNSADSYFSKAYRLFKERRYGVTTGFLKAYLASAYNSGDVEGGKEAINALAKLSPRNRLVSHLKSFYSSLKRPSLAYKRKHLSSYTPKRFKHSHKQVVIDAVILNSVETQNNKRGFNLLSGLKMSYAGDVQFRSDNSNTGGAAPKDVSGSTSILNAFSLSKLNYDLNIFNNFDELDEILARPSLLVKDGDTGKFFSGSKLILGITGADAGSVTEFPLGTYLNVTPEFQKDGTVNLKIKIGRDTLSYTPNTATSFDQTADTLNQSTETTVNLHFNQTVVLSTLALNLSSSYSDKTPVLGDIPLVNTFFSNKGVNKLQGTLLFLLTPRPVTSFYTSFSRPNLTDLHAYYKGLISRNSNFKYNISKLRILSIYHFPLRLTPALYDKRTFNRAVTHEYKKIN